MNPRRRPLIVGNWKMNHGGPSGCHLAAEIARGAGPFSRVDIVVAPPFTALAAVSLGVHAADPEPPTGFTALFNGKDLAGWHGMPHFDPYKLAALSEAERKAQIDKWTEDARRHWQAENGELVNDGTSRTPTVKVTSIITTWTEYKSCSSRRSPGGNVCK